MANPNGHPQTLKRKLPGSFSRGCLHRKEHECLDLQADMLAIASNEAMKPLERSSAARVWKELELVRRAMKGLANPAPAKSEPKTRSKSTPVPRVVD